MSLQQQLRKIELRVTAQEGRQRCIGSAFVPAECSPAEAREHVSQQIDSKLLPIAYRFASFDKSAPFHSSGGAKQTRVSNSTWSELLSSDRGRATLVPELGCAVNIQLCTWSRDRTLQAAVCNWHTFHELRTSVAAGLGVSASMVRLQDQHGALWRECDCVLPSLITAERHKLNDANASHQSLKPDEQKVLAPPVYLIKAVIGTRHQSRGAVREISFVSARTESRGRGNHAEARSEQGSFSPCARSTRYPTMPPLLLSAELAGLLRLESMPTKGVWLLGPGVASALWQPMMSYKDGVARLRDVLGKPAASDTTMLSLGVPDRSSHLPSTRDDQASSLEQYTCATMVEGDWLRLNLRILAAHCSGLGHMRQKYDDQSFVSAPVVTRHSLLVESRPARLPIFVDPRLPSHQEDAAHAELLAQVEAYSACSQSPEGPTTALTTQADADAKGKSLGSGAAIESKAAYYDHSAPCSGKPKMYSTISRTEGLAGCPIKLLINGICTALSRTSQSGTPAHTQTNQGKATLGIGSSMQEEMKARSIAEGSLAEEGHEQACAPITAVRIAEAVAPHRFGRGQKGGENVALMLKQAKHDSTSGTGQTLFGRSQSSHILDVCQSAQRAADTFTQKTRGALAGNFKVFHTIMTEVQRRVDSDAPSSPQVLKAAASGAVGATTDLDPFASRPGTLVISGQFAPAPALGKHASKSDRFSCVPVISFAASDRWTMAASTIFGTWSRFDASWGVPVEVAAFWAIEAVGLAQECEGNKRLGRSIAQTVLGCTLSCLQFCRSLDLDPMLSGIEGESPAQLRFWQDVLSCSIAWDCSLASEKQQRSYLITEVGSAGGKEHRKAKYQEAGRMVLGGKFMWGISDSSGSYVNPANQRTCSESMRVPGQLPSTPVAQLGPRRLSLSAPRPSNSPTSAVAATAPREALDETGSIVRNCGQSRGRFGSQSNTEPRSSLPSGRAATTLPPGEHSLKQQVDRVYSDACSTISDATRKQATPGRARIEEQAAMTDDTGEQTGVVESVHTADKRRWQARANRAAKISSDWAAARCPGPDKPNEVTEVLRCAATAAHLIAAGGRDGSTGHISRLQATAMPATPLRLGHYSKHDSTCSHQYVPQIVALQVDGPWAAFLVSKALADYATQADAIRTPADIGCRLLWICRPHQSGQAQTGHVSADFYKDRGAPAGIGESSEDNIRHVDVSAAKIGWMVAQHCRMARKLRHTPGAGLTTMQLLEVIPSRTHLTLTVSHAMATRLKNSVRRDLRIASVARGAASTDGEHVRLLEVPEHTPKPQKGKEFQMDASLRSTSPVGSRRCSDTFLIDRSKQATKHVLGTSSTVDAPLSFDKGYIVLAGRVLPQALVGVVQAIVSKRRRVGWSVLLRLLSVEAEEIVSQQDQPDAKIERHSEQLPDAQRKFDSRREHETTILDGVFSGDQQEILRSCEQAATAWVAAGASANTKARAIAAFNSLFDDEQSYLSFQQYVREQQPAQWPRVQSLLSILEMDSQWSDAMDAIRRIDTQVIADDTFVSESGVATEVKKKYDLQVLADKTSEVLAQIVSGYVTVSSSLLAIPELTEINKRRTCLIAQLVGIAFARPSYTEELFQALCIEPGQIEEELGAIRALPVLGSIFDPVDGEDFSGRYRAMSLPNMPSDSNSALIEVMRVQGGGGIVVSLLKRGSRRRLPPAPNQVFSGITEQLCEYVMKTVAPDWLESREGQLALARKASTGTIPKAGTGIDALPDMSKVEGVTKDKGESEAAHMSDSKQKQDTNSESEPCLPYCGCFG